MFEQGHITFVGYIATSAFCRSGLGNASRERARGVQLHSHCVQIGSHDLKLNQSLGPDVLRITRLEIQLTIAPACSFSKQGRGGKKVARYLDCVLHVKQLAP